MIIYIDGVYGTSITVTLLLNGARLCTGTIANTND